MCNKRRGNFSKINFFNSEIIVIFTYNLKQTDYEKHNNNYINLHQYGYSFRINSGEGNLIYYDNDWILEVN